MQKGTYGIHNVQNKEMKKFKDAMANQKQIIQGWYAALDKDKYKRENPSLFAKAGYTHVYNNKIFK